MARSRMSKSPEKGTKWFKTISPPTTPLTTMNGQSPSPRTSPGLLAGHYAGCKFTEPPAPSALPQPPKHWVLTPREQPFDIAHQLKVLLKVQA